VGVPAPRMYPGALSWVRTAGQAISSSTAISCMRFRGICQDALEPFSVRDMLLVLCLLFLFLFPPDEEMDSASLFGFHLLRFVNDGAPTEDNT